MALLFKLHKIVRTFKDNRQDKANNKWFAKALCTETVSSDKIAELIQNRCTLTKSDVRACIEAFTEVIREQIQDSKAVKLEGLGTFKIGLKCEGAETVNDFSVQSNIVGARVLFYPARTKDTSGKQIIELLRGLKVKETSYNDVSKD